jgi:hypothetical protein
MRAKVKNLGIPRIQVEIITELAFLRIFIAWENFLEESFIRYLVGAKSPSGYSPKRFVNTPNMEIAKKIILGERSEYIRWNSSGKVIARSETYFKGGEPYGNVLRGAATDLNDMNVIRNRITHMSTISKAKFINFVRRRFGHGKRGMTPGRLLLTPLATQTTFFDHYVAIIKTTSKIIIKI